MKLSQAYALFGLRLAMYRKEVKPIDKDVGENRRWNSIDLPME